MGKASTLPQITHHFTLPHLYNTLYLPYLRSSHLSHPPTYLSCLVCPAKPPHRLRPHLFTSPLPLPAHPYLPRLHTTAHCTPTHTLILVAPPSLYVTPPSLSYLLSLTLHRCHVLSEPRIQ